MDIFFKYLDIPLRSVIAFFVLFLLTRLLGKKQMSHLTFFDYITGIAIGSVAASMSVDNSISYLNGTLSLIVWGTLPLLMAVIAMKSIKLRRFMDGVPTILIQNGKIIYSNLKKELFNINDLMQELRLKGVFDIQDVEFAILETDGELSIKFKSDKRPVTPSDMNIGTQYEGISAHLIIDGKIMSRHLDILHLDEYWLKN